jgi:gliding motility-associated-like protein
LPYLTETGCANYKNHYISTNYPKPLRELVVRANILIFCLLVAVGHRGSLFSQTPISGIVNTTSAAVTSLGPDFVTVTDLTGFAEGDTVLLIQMKGARIYTLNDPSYGTPEDILGLPGGYEFIIIQQIIGAEDKLIFGANLLNNYSVEGMVQAIKVRSYSSARVTGTLTANPWNSVTGTGGVLAIIVGGTLKLEANIDVSGKGFHGGLASSGTGEPVSLDDALRNRYFYDASSEYSGFKGEGLAIKNHLLVPIYPAFVKGKGANLNGGGGGNGRFAGGGGGSNFGKGGNGYREDLMSNDATGIGAYTLYGRPQFQNGLFIGGGGGASTYKTGTASDGGNGGGIVIIIADTIHGNGHSIISNGLKPSIVATGEAGAAGGGGGGSIALSVNSFVVPITLSVNGGAGGDTENTYGSGGGGGGGRIWASTPLTGVTVSVSGGEGGRINFPPGSPIASPGSSGRTDTNFAAKLNGFLFNSIRSEITLSNADSICHNLIPPKLIGTEPIGGTLPYTYLWERSYDSITWLPLANSEVPGMNFTPSATETDTLWFRRTITDATPITPLVDISKAVKINVTPLITDNIVGKDTTICFNQDPLELKHYNSGPGGGNGTYKYLWKQGYDNILFPDTATGSPAAAAYNPPALTQTTYYQRIITSGRCVDVSGSVKVTVLPLIANNSIAADEVICESELFTNLTGSVPTGGDGAGSYTYRWLSKTGVNPWSPAAGTNTSQGYDPDESEFPAIRQYARVVYSGAYDVCRDTTTATVQLTMHPAIAGNTIAADQIICSDFAPAIITGAIPTGGDGSYLYTWQDSSRLQGWTNIPAFINTTEASYQPPPLQDSTWYRRIVFSSACMDISNVIRVYVHKPLADFDISLLSGGADTTICRGATPNLLDGEAATGGTNLPGDYAYAWLYSLDNINWIPVAAAGTGKDFQPPSLIQTTWFRRKVTSGQCSDTSATAVRVTVLPLIAGNTLPADFMECYGIVPQVITGSQPTGGDGATYTYLWEQSSDNGVTWGNATGANAGRDYQPPALTIPMKYRRVVTSGANDCCIDVSLPVSVGIHQLPVAAITSVTDTVCRGGSMVINFNISSSVASPWNIQYSDGTNNFTIPSAGTASYNVTVSPTLTTIYSLVSVTDNNGCIATSLTGSFNAVVYEVPVAKTSPDASDEICGLRYNLTPVRSVGTGRWITAGVPVTSSSDLGSGVLQVEVGTYNTWTFTWEETNWQCVDDVTLDVKFWEAPSPVDAGADLTTVLGFVKLNAVPPVLSTSMKWSFPGNPADILYDDATDPATWVSGLRIGQNLFTWTVENGKCIVDDVLSVTYNPVPEGFSPDGNGINDFFEIPGLEDTNNELVILNLSGQEVIRLNNYSSVSGYWDGKDRNGRDLPDGTYYYFLTVLNPYQSKLGGYVIIKRRNEE